MARTADVLHSVWTERQKQDIKWGPGHDNHHTSSEWRELIRDRIGREPYSHADDRRLLIETAAIAVAAVEAMDRRAMRADRA